MNVALVKNNKVENMIVVETLQWAQENLSEYDEIINTTGIEIGIEWTKVNNVWINPNNIIPAIIYKNILTPLEFLNRFTPNEAKEIMRLSKQDPDVELWWLKYNKAQEMDLDDPQTIEGVQALEFLGIIAVGRAAEILTSKLA